MKILLFALSISSVFAQEVRFEPEFEKKCFKEVSALKCGDPDKDKNAFMKCVDSKIKNLTPECQGMHKAIKHEDHKH